MKDNMKTCQHIADAEYKEVVVIGNGPSGMVTSFMLAGNVPYLKNIPDDLPIDEMLRARLSNLPQGISLYEADLMELAEGLEGRSQNPIPLLMDNLLRPCADLGIMADPLIEWKHEADKQVDHIVLGRGPPGGAWHTFPGGVRTLSPAAWLWLPPHGGGPGAHRLRAAAVALYCRRYVHALHLQRYFRNNVVVTSVSVIPPSEREECEGVQCPHNATYQVTGYEVSTGSPFRYICSRVVVCGGGGARPNTLPVAPQHLATYSLTDFVHSLNCLRNTAVGSRVLVVGGGLSGADAVVAALGGGARVAHLHRGPADTLARLDPHTYPEYTQVYKMMVNERINHSNYKSYSNHVIINVSSLHPHRDTIEDTQTKIVTLLNLETNTTTELHVEIIGIFIGSKPDLSFLQLNYYDICECTKKVKRKIEDKTHRNHWSYIKSMLGQSIQICKARYLNNFSLDVSKCDFDKCKSDIDKCQCDIDKCDCDKCNCDFISKEFTCDNYIDGIGFGIDPKKPIDSKNPIAIDKSTHEVINAPKGVYALGPLTADNFVRFIPGGALAAVSHILKNRN